MARLLRSSRCIALAGLLATLGTMLAACSSGEDAAPAQATDAAPLPQPLQPGGAITDMPARPGPGDVPLAGSAPPPPPEPADTQAELDALLANPETGLAEAAQPVPAPGDARQVLRDYYAAINARDFATAQAAWADGAAAQTLAQDFADASVELTLGDPRPVADATGTETVEVPVTVTTTRADGTVQYQAGRYTLRRFGAGGGTPAQRAWRIAAVDLRDAAR